MKNWVEQSPITVGVGLVVAGFVLIFLAWNGAAGRDFIESQFPYIISGGLTGLALIGAGLTVVVVHSRRTDTKELAARIDELTDAIRDLTGSPAPRRRARAEETAETRPRGARPGKAKATRRTRARQPR